MKVGTKLAFGYSIIILLMVLVAAIALRTYVVVREELKYVRESIIPCTIAMDRMNESAIEANHQIVKYMIYNRPENKQLAQASLSELYKYGQKHLKYENHIDDKEKTAAKELIAKIDCFAAAAEKVFALEKGKNTTSCKLLKETKGIMNPVVDGLAERLAKHRLVRTKELAEAEDTIWKSHLLGFGAIILTTIIIALLAVFGWSSTTKTIVKPLQKLEEYTRKIGKGDLTWRVGTHYKDEIGALSRAFDDMTIKLSQTLVSRQTIARTNRLLSEQITARENAESSLLQANENLKQKNEDLQQFSYVASHDLQEPLRMVTNYLQLLDRRYKDKLDSDAHDFINFAVDGAKRMQALIKDLLVYSRAGTRAKELVSTDCQEILKHTLFNLETRISERGAKVTTDPMPTVLADETQISLVFQNLISNALKFHDTDHPEVHVSARQNEGDWVFSIRDNGIGMAPEHADRIFVMFQRLHGREKYPGTGIGLAICKKIVNRHNGKIWVESRPGHGSTFYFTIPEDMEMAA